MPKPEGTDQKPLTNEEIERLLEVHSGCGVPGRRGWPICPSCEDSAPCHVNRALDELRKLRRKDVVRNWELADRKHAQRDLEQERQSYAALEQKLAKAEAELLTLRRGIRSLGVEEVVQELGEATDD